MGKSESDTVETTSLKNPEHQPVQRALISVSDKKGLEPFVRALTQRGIEILSTGGTAAALKKSGLIVTDISTWTGFPEIMDGRVKTLHPKVHGGILARRDDESHRRAMDGNGIGAIDMVVVNLYPFAQTVQRGAAYDECVENIDIGGPAMIRAAAKNHAFVTVVTNPEDYDRVLANMDSHNGAVSFDLRQKLAAKAFAHTAWYDTNIANWFSGQTGEGFPVQAAFAGNLKQTLRYGENPHQKAALYVDGSNRPGVATARQLQGKELSYNNLNDTDAAFELVAEFDEPAVAIIKHANPCGVASASSMIESYKLALRCDPVSAFGGIIALNRPLDAVTAAEITKIFSEVIITPSVDDDALPVLAKKQNLRVLVTDGKMPVPAASRRALKTIAGGFLTQDVDNGRVTSKDLKIVTKRQPTPDELRDMLFAFRVCKHVKSNAIIFAKNNATAGIGAGQMSRLDSTLVAARKAAEAARTANLSDSLAKGCVAASDAFFPFPDGLLACADAGATAVIQPGGSIKDADVIAAADERGLAMVFTGMRHFRH